MNRVFMTARYLASMVVAAAGISACGGPIDAPFGASLEAPDAREARVSVTPALDVSALIDGTLAERILIEEITVNLGDARLLGADPAIPVGGLVLMNGARIVRANGDGTDFLELPFPEQFLHQSDLAVYLRIEQSSKLEGASVVVRGRLHERPVAGGTSFLSAWGSATDPDGDPANPAGATDPDGDPANPSGATDPDGDPANPSGATDPDGDPALCSRCGVTRRSLVKRSADNPSIPFELRDDDATDLVARLGGERSLDVVVGIPAARWLTPEVVDALNEALQSAELVRQQTPPGSQRDPSNRRDEVIVVQTQDPEASARERVEGHTDSNPGDDYFLSEDAGNIERLTVRRGD